MLEEVYILNSVVESKQDVAKNTYSKHFLTWIY